MRNIRIVFAAAIAAGCIMLTSTTLAQDKKVSDTDTVGVAGKAVEITIYAEELRIGKRPPDGRMLSEIPITLGFSASSAKPPVPGVDEDVITSKSRNKLDVQGRALGLSSERVKKVRTSNRIENIETK